MDGKRYHCNYFPIFFYGQRKGRVWFSILLLLRNPRGDFSFFGVEDPVHTQKLCTGMMRKLKNKVCGLWRKNVYNLHRASPEKSKALCGIVLRGVFGIHLNIHNTAFLRKQLMAFGIELFSQKCSIAEVRLGSK